MRLLLLFLFSLSFNCLFAQTNVTELRGVVVDSVNQMPMPYVSVKFDKTTIGTLTDGEGRFVLRNNTNKVIVSVSYMGYKTKIFHVSLGKNPYCKIMLKPNNLLFREVIVSPKKQKYSKKNNPAVELIKKVIAHKGVNNIATRNNYQCDEYEQLILALNNFKPNEPQFRRFPFFSKYTSHSLLGHKLIFPFSLREKRSQLFYRKDPQALKRLTTGYHIEGIDKFINTEALDAIIKQTFSDVSIYDNSITFLLHKFVSPLNNYMAVSFYKWYITDTIKIDDKPYIKLDFAPFNGMDTGFTGSLYVATDGSYGIKRAVLYAPKNINVNFIDGFVMIHDFEQDEKGSWLPKEKRTAINFTLVNAMKFYSDRIQSYSHYVFDKPAKHIYEAKAPEIFTKNYQKHDEIYWKEHRPANHSKDYHMQQMMEQMNKYKFFKVLLAAGKIVSNGYVATSSDMDRNKFDIGTVPTFYSYNPVEGNRFRLTLSTTKNLFPHLFFYAYGAYGTKDEKFKYSGEVTWAFNNPKYHKDEFPKNNLSLSYENDMTDLGQQYTQAERDNILMSLRAVKEEKLTYSRKIKLMYDREYFNHLSFNIAAQSLQERPAGDLVFRRKFDDNHFVPVKALQFTEAMVAVRFAPNEKFVQMRRERYPIASEKLQLNLSYAQGLKGIFGGQYNYGHLSFAGLKEIWIPSYGKLNINVTADKIFGKAPFPMLVSPSTNHSYTVQSGSFYLIRPMEFIHDTQVAAEVYYHFGGWLLNKIPIIKLLKWRTLVGFRGFYGSLSNKNNPLYNQSLLQMPDNTFTTKHEPYMEYNVGIENIFRFFRIDYVRRLNYLNHPGINKDGVRVSFQLDF